MKKHLGDFSLMAILLGLLFLPVGSFGLAEVRSTNDRVLSVVDTREEVLEAEESSEASSVEVQEPDVLEATSTAVLEEL